MDRLISLEPSNVVAIRIEPGQRCCGVLTLRNVMHTMPVAFRLQPINKPRYTVKPQSGIISPLATVTVEITCHLPPGVNLPDTFPYCDDSFLLHSVVVPGAAIKDSGSTLDSVPSDWFTARKKQVFIDSGIKVMFLGSQVISRLVLEGNSIDDIRTVLERSDPSWRPADSVDPLGQTLLHLAIAQGRPDLVQLLLEFNPDVEARSRSGSSPLEEAASLGEALIAELLLAHGASTERAQTAARGPIHLAVGGGHVEVLKLLLLKGAEVDATTRDGNTALHITAEEHRRDCARLLISSGARTDVRNSEDWETPLHIAARSGDEHMVRLLLHKGANKEIRNRYGKTAYDVAAEHGHVRLFDALKLGDKLCLAAKKGDVRTIQRLLEGGAAVNGRDQHGWTALHRAAFKGRTEAARVLIDKGAETDSRDEDGYTPLHCAAESGHADVIELLVKKGADTGARTNKGMTALQIAESLHYSGITRMLAHGGTGSKEGSGNARGYGPNPCRKGLVNRVAETDNVKKKHSRGRSMRSSFDQSSVPLAVL
ncbi:ankyrin-1-like [Punica granatum]|uniref:Uncharacterized protein n=2 Tax=Punica granatum TaxID=22663 RepID=A0A2I0HR35_PUNGR|nr:ankyrin-1-like [Punica granatum]PKI34053.1 hypothetical protein CRG98_045510 [Punica granatum]